MFLDDTACNLASANLITFYSTTTKRFDVESYEHLCRLWTIVLEISVMMAQFPSRRSPNSPTSSAHAGLRQHRRAPDDHGASLRQQGRPRAVRRADRDHDRRRLCDLGRDGQGTGPFPGYKKNTQHMLRVIRNHRRAAHGESRGYEAPAVSPVPLDHASCPQADVITHAKAAWDKAPELGELNGYRNAQTTVVAPTGTIGLVMDCDTTGIEPDFALVKFKSSPAAATGRSSTSGARGAADARLPRKRYRGDRGLCRRPRLAVQRPGINASTLKAKGFTDEALAKVEKALPTAFDIKFAFNKWTFGEDLCATRSTSRPRRSRPPASTCSPRWASPSARSRPPTCTSAAR